MLQIASQVLNLISEFIPDSDKQAELALELKRIEADATRALLSTSTTPKTDAVVKILITVRDVIIPMLRPIGSACMTGFAAYCALNNIQLDGATEAILVSAFPGWMASRHVHKKKENQPTTRPKVSHDSSDEDIFDVDG